jgi:hypothetical protein
MSLQPWPDNVLPLRQLIQAEHNRIQAMFQVCLSEGIEEQNYRLIELLLPKIKIRAERISATCRQIQQLVPPRRRGRDPKWSIVTLDVNVLATRLLRCVEIIRQEYPANRFITIGYLLKIGLETCQRIEEHLEKVPAGEENDADVPAAFRFAFESGWTEE